MPSITWAGAVWAFCITYEMLTFANVDMCQMLVGRSCDDLLRYLLGSGYLKISTKLVASWITVRLYFQISKFVPRASRATTSSTISTIASGVSRLQRTTGAYGEAFEDRAPEDTAWSVWSRAPDNNWFVLCCWSTVLVTFRKVWL